MKYVHNVPLTDEQFDAVADGRWYDKQLLSERLTRIVQNFGGKVNVTSEPIDIASVTPTSEPQAGTDVTIRFTPEMIASYVRWREDMGGVKAPSWLEGIAFQVGDQLTVPVTLQVPLGDVQRTIQYPKGLLHRDKIGDLAISAIQAQYGGK